MCAPSPCFKQEDTCSDICVPDRYECICYNETRYGKNCTDQDGGWSNWSEWSLCFEDYRERRTRSCNEPETLGNGTYCEGNSTIYRECSNVDDRYLEYFSVQFVIHNNSCSNNNSFVGVLINSCINQCLDDLNCNEIPYKPSNENSCMILHQQCQNLSPEDNSSTEYVGSSYDTKLYTKSCEELALGNNVIYVELETSSNDVNISMKCNISNDERYALIIPSSAEYNHVLTIVGSSFKPSFDIGYSISLEQIQSMLKKYEGVCRQYVSLSCNEHSDSDYALHNVDSTLTSLEATSSLDTKSSSLDTTSSFLDMTSTLDDTSSSSIVSETSSYTTSSIIDTTSSSIDTSSSFFFSFLSSLDTTSSYFPNIKSWSSSNNIYTYWPGGRPSISCSCGIYENCVDPSKSCNCDSHNHSSDSGYIDEAHKLPVTEISINEYDDSLVYIHPLKCFKQQKTPPGLIKVAYHVFDIDHQQKNGSSNESLNWTFIYNKQNNISKLRMSMSITLRCGFNYPNCYKLSLLIGTDECIISSTSRNYSTVMDVQNTINSRIVNVHFAYFLDVMCDNIVPAGNIELGFKTESRCQEKYAPTNIHIGFLSDEYLTIQELELHDQSNLILPYSNEVVFNLKNINFDLKTLSSGEIGK